jgi:prevent-host-death family protein
MDNLISLTEAKGRLAALVRECEEGDVVILRHGRPAAILVAPAQYEALLEEIEDLRDRLSVYESEASSPDLRVPLDKILAELGQLS